MDHDTLELIMGIIFLVLIVNTMAIWSIATSNTNPLATDPSGSVSAKTSPGATVSPGATKAGTATPTATPVKTTLATSTKAQTPVPTTQSYVEIVIPTPVAVETREQIQPGFLIRSEEGYKTYYSLTNQAVSEQLPHIIFDVVNPPLLVDFEFTPYNSTDVKLLEYKKIKTFYSENVKMTRPYEDAWFMINITDNDTGEIISQDGVGRTFGLLSKKQLVIPNNGKIGFDLDGQYGNITLTIKMRDPATITAGKQ
jgi:hypothetical protein